jgi:hypothetical protein
MPHAANQRRPVAGVDRPGQRVGTFQVVGVAGQPAPLDAKAVQPQPEPGQFAGDGADLAGGLAAAHAAQPDQRHGGKVDTGLLVPVDAGQVC